MRSPAPPACSRLLHAARLATRPHGHVGTRSQQRGACGLTPWTRLQVRAIPQEQAGGCGEWRPLGAPRSRGCGGAAEPQRDSDGKLLHAIAHPVREGGICYCCLVPAQARARALLDANTGQGASVASEPQQETTVMRRCPGRGHDLQPLLRVAPAKLPALQVRAAPRLHAWPRTRQPVESRRVRLSRDAHWPEPRAWPETTATRRAL